MYLFVTLVLMKVVVLLTWYFFKKRHSYWKKRNVPFLEPTPLLGNYGGYVLLKECSWDIAQRICEVFPNEPYVGTFYGTEPALLVQDPELIKLIMTKDYYHFSGREISPYTHNEVFTKSLFFTYGDRWKVLRQNLTPLFTSGKMKNMFYLIQNYAKGLENLLKEEKSVSDVVDIRTIMIRYTMDCISSCTLGVEARTLESNMNNPYFAIGQKIFLISQKQGYKTVARAIWPRFFYSLGFKLFLPEVDRFFYNLLKGVFEQRNYEPSSRHDFVDLMLSLKKNKVITCESLNKNESKKVSLDVDDDLMVGHCISFFGGGFETSSLTMTFTLYELAKNERAQKQAIQEVDEYLQRHDGKVEYDCLNELPYIEACIYETLRMYPVLGLMTREVEADYTLPTGLLLKKGLRIHVPVKHIHYNADYFPNPEEYNPERFFGDAKKDVKPCSFMPFGEGLRACIGSRFAKMQMFPGLVQVLKQYRLQLSEGTPHKLTMDPKAIVTLPMEPVKLKLVDRK